MKLFLSLLALICVPFLAWGDGTTPGSFTVTAPPVTALQPTPQVNLALAPKIVCSHPKFDFGTVDEGPDITHEFHFRNKGRSTLKITGVSTSCGCTAAVAGTKYPVSTEDKAKGVIAAVPPGGFDVIKATYHTSGRPGHATKVITVSSNDPVNPGFQMTLDMTVVREVDVQPDRLYLYGVHYKTPHNTTIKIMGKPGAPLKIFSAVSTSNVVTILSVAPVTEYAAPVSAGGVTLQKGNRIGATIDVSLPVTQAIGAFTDEIVIKTDNIKKPEIKVSVMGDVVGRLQANPKTLIFSPGQTAPVTVQLTADPAAGFVIRSVRSEKHLSRPSVKKIAASNGVDQYTLAVSPVKSLPKDSDGKDRILIRTNDKDQPELALDVVVNK